LLALGFDQRRIVFSSDTSETQFRSHAKGRGTVDCCYPVKCMSGHYGELLARDAHRKVDVILSPKIYSLPSFLGPAAVDSLACPRVMAAAENIRAGFMKHGDVFAERGVCHAAPVVALGDRAIVPDQLFEGLRDVIPGLTAHETRSAVAAGYDALSSYDQALRRRSFEILASCAHHDRPAILVLARPYHMDPGIGHEIETELQRHGYPVLWSQYLPLDDTVLDWLFGADVRDGRIRSALDISDVWPSSYSANTNEILWGAKFAARMPWIACVLRLASYECGMDQPTYTPVQQIVERSGTLFFSFQDLDATKPAGSVRIRIETIAYYLEQRYRGIVAHKRAALTAVPRCLAESPSPVGDAAPSQAD